MPGAMGAEAGEAVDGNPGHADATGEDSAHRVGVQRGAADAIAGADSAKQRPGFSTRHGLPNFERAHRAGPDVPSARQADLRPLTWAPIQSGSAWLAVASA
jgi:hypothetical protein